MAIATATLLVESGRFDEIIFIMSPCHERKQGFLAGSLQQKSAEYFHPLRDALLTINIMPDKVIHSDDPSMDKNNSPYITAMTDTYIRGRNFGGDSRVIVLVDEAQNYTLAQLRTLLSRVCDNSLVVVTGHQKQVDLPHPGSSGFVKCIEHFQGKDWAEVCTLKTNYRGRVSQWADMMEG